MSRNSSKRYKRYQKTTLGQYKVMVIDLQAENERLKEELAIANKARDRLIREQAELMAKILELSDET